MPLSEHEERILAEIERQLAAEDPRLAARARRGPLPSRTTRLRLAVALALVGVVSLVSLTFHVAFGALGMVLLLGAIVLGAGAITSKEQQQQATRSHHDEGR